MKYQLISKHNQNKDFARYYLVSGIALVILVIASAVCYFECQFGLQGSSFRGDLADSVSIGDIYSHLRALESIALKHPNRSRSVANGHKGSAEYVIHQLKTKTTCNLTTQYFKTPLWSKSFSQVEMSEPFYLKMQDGVDFNLMRDGGLSSDLSNVKLQALEEGKFGCESADFEDFTKGNAVVIPMTKMNCTLFEASYNAELAGASAVFWRNTEKRTSLYNSRVRVENWKLGDSLVSIPVFSVSHAIGAAMVAAVDQVQFNIKTVTEQQIYETFNVICDTLEGDSNSIGMLGAHLDSVPVEGDTGMSDNASGSSALLQTVLALYSTGLNKDLVNKMRFAWWSAEEIGLLGSRHYARVLSENPEEFRKVVAYGNHDMLGSPNYVPFIYRGGSAPKALQYGSTQLQKLYEEYFNSLPVSSKFYRNFEYSDMSGGSDFYSFLEVNIPASGLATGAGITKTEEQRQKYGGFADAQLDPCYHQVCDKIENINAEVLEVNAKAVAHVTQRMGLMNNLHDYFSLRQ